MELLDPCEMLNNKFDHGAVFQQYFQGVPQRIYYICCGPYEDSVIHIWFSDEEDEYRLSTDNLQSLKELNSNVKVKQCDVDIKMKLLINNL
jgi:hypothetical protein